MTPDEVHNMVYTRAAWQGMKDECYSIFHPARNNSNPSKMCKSWINSFYAFYTDMGMRPAGHVLVRINNSESFSKENCKWQQC